MKVFFLSSNCSNKLWDDYKLIINILKKDFNCNVVDEFTFVNGHETDQLPDKKIAQRARMISKEIIGSDALVYEGTISSTGAGYYLAIALREKVPVLFLAQERYTGLLLSEPNSFLQIEQYTKGEKEELNEIISKFLAFAGKKRMSLRFNLMINDEISNYLKKRAKDKNLSKADLIRDLIYEEMRLEIDKN